MRHACPILEITGWKKFWGQFWLSSELFSSNYFRIGQHVVLEHMQIETQRLQRFLCESPSKTQFQIGYFDQSQQKQPVRWSTPRSEFLPITWNLLKAREKSRVHGVIGLAPYWLKDWRENFKPTTRRRSRNCVVTFKSHLKTALFVKKKMVSHEAITR